MVQQAIHQQRVYVETALPTPPEPPTTRGPNRLLVYLRSLRALNSDDYQRARLDTIINVAVNSEDKEATFQSLSLYLRDILSSTPSNITSRRRQPSAPSTSRRKARRREYATVQRHWKQNRARCITSILEGIDDAQQPSRDIMEAYWTNVFTQPATNTKPHCVRRPPIEDVWQPITPENIRAARPFLAVSPGPDGLTARQLRAIPPGVLTRICNLILWCGKLPEHLAVSRTIFIPKKPGAKLPGDFRPISVSSVLTRLIHKVLAQRIDQLIQLDEQQRAFRGGIDGCRDNTVLLDAILRSRYTSFRSLYIATLDIAKAFDSVDHTALLAAAEAAGLPPEMISYLRDYYQRSTTTLSGCGWESGPLRVTRGVKQGDPLSPVIFNIIMDHLLRSLPQECGAIFNNNTIRAMAFADDLVLLADSPTGLQHLLDHTARYLKDCGLMLNNTKSHTVAIYGDSNRRKTVVDARATFTIQGQPVRALSREETWVYLGIEFSAEGRRSRPLASQLSPLLQRLTKAPLKPQQRIYALKTTALPKIYYHMALGRITISELQRVDKMVRATVRQWLALPNDTPVGYFHAPVGEGGLGIPSVRWLAPLHRRNRLLGLVRGRDETNITDPYLAKEVLQCNRRLIDGTTIIADEESCKKRWAALLHGLIEGRALKHSVQVANQHQWVTDGTALLTGRDYINCHKVRIGALPTRARTTRGRHGDRSCRAGCIVPETNNHVLQICPRTHGVRIARHNSILSYIGRNLRRQGFTVYDEPHITTSEGLRKPDIIAIMGNLGLVIDAQVAGEQSDLERARTLKIQKYAGNPDIQRAIQDLGATNILHLPAILSCRGVWSKKSADDLLRIGTINRRDLAIIATRVLIGGAIAHRVFNTSTAVKNWNSS